MMARVSLYAFGNLEAYVAASAKRLCWCWHKCHVDVMGTLFKESSALLAGALLIALSALPVGTSFEESLALLAGASSCKLSSLLAGALAGTSFVELLAPLTLALPEGD